MPTHCMLIQTLSLQLARDQNTAMPVRTINIANIAQKIMEPVVFVGKCIDGIT